MNIQEAVERALEEPTLAKALSWIALWECERAIKQARHHFETGERGPDGQGWDTCFERCLGLVLTAWKANEKRCGTCFHWPLSKGKPIEWWKNPWCCRFNGKNPDVVLTADRPGCDVHDTVNPRDREKVKR